MAQLYGGTYTKMDLLRHVGDITQIARIKPYRLEEGKEDGVRALDVTNGSGLSFTVLPSRGMDISAAHYNGHSLAWRSPTTDTHPAYFVSEEEAGTGFLRGFFGGLLTTCGLAYAGASGMDEGKFYGIHGRVTNLPATNVSWDGGWDADDYTLTLRGKVRETAMFGDNLELTRTITTKLGERRFFLHDAVENRGHQTTEHMLLYHINIGFPLVSENSRLISPTLKAIPRDAEAEQGAENYAKFHRPTHGYNEKVYFHEMQPDASGRVTTAIVNPELAAGDGGDRGLGIYCAYRSEQLPRFIEWKMLGEGTYVVGMEPANCSVMGRAHERAAGTLQFLEPGERKEYALEFGVLCGEQEIACLEDACRAAIANR